MKPMSVATSPIRWVATALVLVIEIRECQRCHSTFRVPDDLMIQMETRVAGYHRVWLMPHKSRPGDPRGGVHVHSFLPRERREVHTPIRVCEHCFQTVPENQLTLFPELFQPHYATATRIILAETEAERALAIASSKKKVKIIPRLEDL